MFFALIFVTGGVTVVTWILGIVHFILDIGLNVILYSIRVDRKSTARRVENNI